MIRFLVAAPCVLALWTAPSVAAKPPIWTVKDHDSMIVIFGSVHVLPERLDWRRGDLNRAMAKADDVWFEVIPGDASLLAAQRASVERGLLPQGRTLSALLSPESRLRLATACAKLSISCAQLETMRPWYAELTFAYAIYRKAGASLARGVEASVNAAVPPTARRVALEDPAGQIEMFASAPVADQIASFERALADYERSPHQYRKLIAAWMRGDVKAIERQTVAPVRQASPALYAEMITTRNDAWARSIETRLKGKGRTVIVVGVGHLVGRDGVPAKLRARGIEVQGPS